MVKVISDSSTLYSIEEGKIKNIDIAPLAVTIDNKTYKEFEDINSEDFIKIIDKGFIPVSSQPSIGEVLEIYNRYPEDEILNISMADGLSGTHSSACAAANMADNPKRIHVINSKTLCGPQRYLVELASKMAEEGSAKEEIVDVINELIETSNSFLIPNDFEYLVRGGRLSPIVGKIGGIIKLVPVMTLSKDRKELVKFATMRTFNKAIKRICEFFSESGVDSKYKIYITHGCKEDLANCAKDIILEYIKDVEIEIMKLSPVFITQGGPGCLAIQTIKKH